MQTILSICLPTTYDRRNQFYKLLQEILRQINECGFSDIVEILIDEDAKFKSIGQKRQDLLERATGTFVAGCDSDDWIAPTYILDIVTALINNPDTDHVGFNEYCSVNGKISYSIFSIRHNKWSEREIGYDQVRCANPKSVIRRTKALQAGYDDERHGEDRHFSERVTPLLLSEVFINKPLYHYIHISTNTNERFGIK